MKIKKIHYGLLVAIPAVFAFYVFGDFNINSFSNPEGVFSVEAMNPFEAKTCENVYGQFFIEGNKILDKLDEQGISYKGQLTTIAKTTPEGQKLQQKFDNTIQVLKEMECDLNKLIPQDKELLYQFELYYYRTQKTLSNPYWICEKYYDEGKTEILQHMKCDLP